MFPFVSEALASTESGSSQGWIGMAPFILIFLVFYFLVIMPQQKKQKKHKQMLNRLEKGDEVLTSSGIFGSIVKIIDDKNIIHIEIADKIIIKIVREYISEVTKKKAKS